MERFFSEPCVTLAYLEPCHIQNLRNIHNPVKHLDDVAFFWWTRTYSEPWQILKPWYIQNPFEYIDEVFYSEPLTRAHLESWYIQNLSMVRTLDIQNTVNL